MAITLNGTTNVITPTTAVQPQHAIVNVHYALKTDTATEEVADGAISGVLFSTNYAAASSSNKLLIMMQLTCGCDTSSIYPCLMIGGSESFKGDSAGNRQLITTGVSADSIGDNGVTQAVINYVHTSPSTSSTAYGVAFRHGNNATEGVALNRSHGDADQSYQARGASSIIIMEIQG